MQLHSQQKQTELKLKTQPEQVIGSLPLASLPVVNHLRFGLDLPLRLMHSLMRGGGWGWGENACLV
jgi:hypothetical protein